MSNNLDTIRNNLVNEFYDNSIMLNVAMNIEYFLSEEALIYPYANWSKGEIISGPFIKRYNVSIILRYEYEDMPDPEGALVLKRFGVQTQYKKIEETVTVKDGRSNKQETKPAWYVVLNFPRGLISDEEQNKALDMIDELVDLEALETAANANMEHESSFEMDDDFGDLEGGDEMDLDPETGGDAAPDEEV